MPIVVLLGCVVPAALELLLFLLAPRRLAALAVVPLSVARTLPLPTSLGAQVAYRTVPGPILGQLSLPAREPLALDGAPGAIEWRAGHAWARVPRWTLWTKHYAVVRVDFHEVDGALACTSRYLPFPFLGLVCAAIFGGAFMITALGEAAFVGVTFLLGFAAVVTVIVRARARDAAEAMIDAIDARLPRHAVGRIETETPLATPGDEERDRGDPGRRLREP